MIACAEGAAEMSVLLRRLMIAVALATLPFFGRASDARVPVVEPDHGLLPDPVFTDSARLRLEVRSYATLPPSGKTINSMTVRPGDDRLYVAEQSGKVFAVGEARDSEASVVEWFDLGQALASVQKRRIYRPRTRHGGLRSLAFHPEFLRNGRFYSTQLEDRPADPSLHVFLGQSLSGFAGESLSADSVLSEWTYDHRSGRVVANSYREVFRVNLPRRDHPIKQAVFNPLARSGDEDYGLLYVGHGDSGGWKLTFVGGQNRDDALGKVLRIDPLETPDAPYGVRGSPFADDPDTLDEIFALGFRNPHSLSFARDRAGRIRLIVAEVGRDNVDEINLVEPGGNHGWAEREGIFVHDKYEYVDPFERRGYRNGISPLPAVEAEFGYAFPVAQVDHDSEPGSGPVGVAISGGFVIQNGSALDGQYIFADFGASGRVYHVAFDAMLAAVTRLATGQPPGALSQAPVGMLKILFDHDADPTTPARVVERFQDVLGAGVPRSDVRFGRGTRGEMYISSKQTGEIFLVTNSVPPRAAPAASR